MIVKSSIFLGIALFVSGCQKPESNAAQKESAPSIAVPTPKPVPVVPVAKKSYEGPFGLAMGIVPSELTDTFGFKSVSESPSQFSGVPPKPAPDFDAYYATATPGQGICILAAIQHVSVVNATGDQLKERVDSVAEMVSLKYGEHTEKIDYTNQDVYRRNPQFWMMALTEDARSYAYSWQAGKKNKTLPSNIKNIEVFASATTMNAGAVVIKYYFENEKKCAAEKRAQKATNL